MEAALRKDVSLGYEEALAKLPELLKAEGFGVLTEIDVKATLKTKIGADFRKYKILGACNPHIAYQVLSKELAVGVMLPCNVVVHERDGGGSTVLAIDPVQTLAAKEPALAAFAADVRDRLARVLDRL